MRFIGTLLLTLWIASLSVEVFAGEYNDRRCRCTCKESVALRRPQRVFTTEVLQEDCNCLTVVFGNETVGNETAEALHRYCLGCQCDYEVRSTKTMEVVVIMYVSLVLLLFLYIAGVVIVDVIRKHQSPRASPGNEHERLMMEDQGPSTSNSDNYHHRRIESTSSGHFVMRRITDAQEEWKRQLQSQRNKVFERRNVLQ